MLRPWTRYINDMQQLFSQRLAQMPALVLWRAYGPTHFGGPTGTYTGVLHIAEFLVIRNYLYDRFTWYILSVFLRFVGQWWT